MEQPSPSSAINAAKDGNNKSNQNEEGGEENLLNLISSFLGNTALDDTTQTTNDEEHERDSNIDEKVASSLDNNQSTTPETTIIHRKQSKPPQIENAKVVIFSKDRPWQLQQLLYSMQLSHSSELKIELCIIVCIQEFYREYYSKVFDDVRKKFKRKKEIEIEVWEEGKDGTFEALLTHALFGNSESKSDNNSTQKGNTNINNDSITMFLTDDCTLLKPLSTILHQASHFLSQNSNILSILGRLHPGITYSQTNSKPSLPPHSSRVTYLPPPPPPPPSYSSDENDGVFVYPLTSPFYTSSGYSNSNEFNYPFDLSGGIYRSSDLQQLLQYMSSKEKSHPNLLEIGGNQHFVTYLQQKKDERMYLAMPTCPTLIILAINRVQSLCHAPLASLSEYETKDLVEFIKEGKMLDMEYYRCTFFDSSHVGIVMLQSQKGKRREEEKSDERQSGTSNATRENENKDSDDSFFDLSILLPINKGPPNIACHAIRSVLLQLLAYQDNDADEEKEETMLKSVQIVIVDDDCVDDSADVMKQCAHDAIYDYNHKKGGDMGKVLLSTNDYREDRERGRGEESEEQKSNNLQPEMDGTNIGIKLGSKCKSSTRKIQLDIHPTPPTTKPAKRKNLATALNYGMQYCYSDYVMRMDADDICIDRRILKQYKCMKLYEKNKEEELCVLGMHMLIFNSSGCIQIDSFETRMEGKGMDENEEGQRFVLPYSREKGSKMTMLQYSPCFSSPSPFNSPPNVRVSIPPTTNAGFVSWLLLFSCCVFHPTVLYRKSVLQKLLFSDDNDNDCNEQQQQQLLAYSNGSDKSPVMPSNSFYNESIQHAEDYELWLRLTSSNCKSITNMPRLGLWHRKQHHGVEVKEQVNEKTSTRIKEKSIIQKEEANNVAVNAMRRLIYREKEKINDEASSSSAAIFSRVASTLRSPDNATISKDLDNAARLLLTLEQCFIDKNDAKLSKREVELIRYDCNERLGEIATILVKKFGHAATKVPTGSSERNIDISYGDCSVGAWGLWCTRCPDLHLERIALLCNSK